MGGARACWQNIVWRVFVGIAEFLLAAGVLLLIVTVLDPELWLGSSLGSVLATASGCLLVAVYVFLLVGGNAVFRGWRHGWGAFYGRYFRTAPRWLAVMTIVLAMAGVGLTVYVYLIGGVTSDFEHAHGRYLEISDGGARAISAAQYTRSIVADTEILPIGMLLLSLDWALVLLFGDRAQRAEIGAKARFNGQ
jgi:hypothetical protein